MQRRFAISNSTLVSILHTSFLVVVLSCLELVDFRDVQTAFITYTIVTILAYGSMIYTSKTSSKGWNSYHIFLVLTFAFYFGGQFLVTFGYYEQLADRMFSVVDQRVTLNAKIQAMNYVLIVLMLINVGYNWKWSKIDFSNTRKKNTTINKKLILQIAMILFWITIIPTFISLGKSVVLSATLGHLEYRSEKAAETGIWFLFSYISGWFRPACFMILLAAENKRSKIVAYAGLIAYCCLYLMTGSRYQIIEIAYCVFAINYIWKDKKIKRGNLVKVIILGLVLVTALKAIGYARAVETGASIFSIEAIKQVFQDNIIYEIFYTTSTTFTTISNAIMRCPTGIPFNMGKGYLGALLYILPSSLRPSDMTIFNTDVESVFSSLYYNWTLSGYGSSFVAELYYNLGVFGFLVAPFFGGFMARIIGKMECYSNYQHVYAFYSMIFLFSELLWGVRSDLFLVPRHMFLYVFIPWIVLKILHNLISKKSGVSYEKK